MSIPDWLMKNKSTGCKPGECLFTFLGYVDKYSKGNLMCWYCGKMKWR